MARRFGRQWTAVLALASLLITISTYYTSRPLSNAPTVVEASESDAIGADSTHAAPVFPIGDEKSSQDEDSANSVVETQDESSFSGQEAQSSQPTSTQEGRTTQRSEPEAAKTMEEAISAVDPKPTKLLTPTESAATDISLQGEEENRISPDAQDTELQHDEQQTEEVGKEEGQAEPEPEPPPPAPTSKIVVMGKLSTEDTDWVSQELSGWQHAIYAVDLDANETSPTGLRTKMNKARESMPYLTYIIDNYPDFPDVVAFIHPHRRSMPKAWHNDARGNDAVNMLTDLRLDTVLDRGYVNLRCNGEVGCPDEVQPFREPPNLEKHAEHAFPYVYGHFFNATFTEMREKISVVATQCCAQFAVSREQLLKLPKYEYDRYRTFLEETHYDDATSGRVMEYMWHIIFGRDAVHCENMFDCWCQVYGRCFGHGRGGGTAGGSHRWLPP